MSEGVCSVCEKPFGFHATKVRILGEWRHEDCLTVAELYADIRGLKDTLSARGREKTQMHNEITALRAALDKERAKVAALREYVEHWDSCENEKDWAMDCTCGLKALLSGRGDGQ